MRGKRGKRLVAAATVALFGAGLSSCSGEHHVLAPDGDQASSTARLGWLMIGLAAVISVVYLVILGWGLARRGRVSTATAKGEDRFVIAAGIALPLVVVITLTSLSLGQLHSTHDGALTIEVTGHQYWWEVHYPDQRISTANELTIPVGQAVDFVLRSADVQHSFWVPSLAGKIDLYPGHTNHLTVVAQQPGTYRGQCAEYCGLQHANMAVLVHAVPADEFDQWARHEAAPAAQPTTASQAAGLTAFQDLPCASCHTIQGTSAHGEVAPDLTHFAARSTIGAGVVPNERGQLGGWIANSQTIKPGNEMPPIPMTPEQLQSLLDYLEHLR